MSDDFVRHWMSNPHGPKDMRSAAHTLIVHGTNAMRSGDTEKAEKHFEIAAELLTTANDAEAGVFDE